MTNIENKLTDFFATRDELEKTLLPGGREFYEFILANQETVGNYLNFRIEDEEISRVIDFDDFNVTFDVLSLNGSSDEGVCYVADYVSYGEMERAFFTVPFSFFDDPEIWQKNFLSSIEKVESEALAALASADKEVERKLNPGESIRVVPLGYMGQPNWFEFSSIVQRRKGFGYGETLPYIFNKATGKIYRISEGTFTSQAISNPGEPLN